MRTRVGFAALFTFFLVFSITGVLASSPRSAPSATVTLREARPGEFLVKLDPNLVVSFAAGLGTLDARFVRQVNEEAGLVLVHVKTPAENAGQATRPSLPAEEAAFRELTLRKLNDLDGVLYAEPNYVFRAIGQSTLAQPNDERFPNQWALKNTGQTDAMGVIGKVGADMKAVQAWDISKGSSEVVVAVVDSGIDQTHPDLKDNLWSMPGNPAVHGRNTFTDPEHPDHKIDPNDTMDDNAHGSHCAGIIGAKGGNGVGISGVNWNVRLMAMKFLDKAGSGSMADAIVAIDWATEHGARVISASWGAHSAGDPTEPQSLREAIARAGAKGVLFVAAAGNDNGANNDREPVWPASIKLPNIVSVGASNNNDNAAEFSNIGPNTVHLIAPGDGILSTTPNGNYQMFSGTSMAAPQVAGAAALLLSTEPSLNPEQLRARLMSSTDKVRSIRRKYISGGRLNLHNLLANVNPVMDVVPENVWSQPVPVTIGTPHPVESPYRNHWTVEREGATYLRVRFKKFSTERYYAIVRLIDATAKEVIDTMQGDLPDNSWSVEVPGSKLMIDINTDYANPSYGFDVDAYQWTSWRPIGSRIR